MWNFELPLFDELFINYYKTSKYYAIYKKNFHLEILIYEYIFAKLQLFSTKLNTKKYSPGNIF